MSGTGTGRADEMDDPLSYEIPDQPGVEHLTRKLIIDFTAYEAGSQVIIPPDTPIPGLLSKPRMNPHAHKNQMLKGYANGTIRPGSAVQALRWSYIDELDGLQKTEETFDDFGKRYISFLRKLLAQPDEFFVNALEVAKPTLKALADSYKRIG